MTKHALSVQSIYILLYNVAWMVATQVTDILVELAFQ